MKYLKNIKFISILVLSLFFLNQNAVAQYCTPNTTDNYMYIDNIQFADVNNDTGNSLDGNGYSDYTGITGNLKSGMIYNFYIRYSYPWNNNVYVWIDYNNDGDFYDTGEEILSATNQDMNDGNYNFTILNSTIAGNYRMRIRYGYGGTNGSDPCNNTYYGEIEDYTVNVSASNIIVTDIIHDDFNNNPGTTDSVGVEVFNNSAFDYSSYSVSLSVLQPDETIKNYSETFNEDFNNGATLTNYIHDVDFSQGGEYVITAVTTLAGVDNISREESFEQAPFPVPYTNFSDYEDWWNIGNGFYWNGTSDIRQYNMATGVDSIISPAFYIPKDGFTLYYDTYSSLQVNDTVFVQVAIVGGAFVNKDTIFSTDNGSNFDLSIDLSAYVGKRIQMQYRAEIASSGLADFRLNDISIKAGYDFVANYIEFPNNSSCGSTQYPVKVNVENTGEIDQTNIEVSVRVYGTVDKTLTTTITTTLQAGDDSTVTVGYINTTQAGTYEFIATVKAPRDDADDNNTVTDIIEIEEPEALIVDIQSAFWNYDWDNDNFNISNDIYSDDILRDDSASITSFRIGEITEGANLYFDYLVYSRNDIGVWDYLLGEDDIINVYIAEDYQGTYNKVATLDSAHYVSSNQLQSFAEISLAAYEGKNIVVKFELKNGAANDTTERIRLTVDNLYIGQPEVDVAVTDIYTNLDQWCGNSSTQFDVRVSNNNSRFDAINVPLYFELNPETGTEYKHLFTIDTIHAGEQNVIVTLDSTYNMTAQGKYYATAYTKANYDNADFNDVFNSDFSVKEMMTLPYVEDFSGSAFYDDWANDNFATGGNNLYTDFTYEGESAYLISPKFGEITTGSYIAFTYKVIAYDDGLNNIGNYLREGDTLKVYLSDDCGTSWTEVYNLNHTNVGNIDEWQFIPNIDISSYAGKSLRTKIEFTKQNETGANKVEIDDFAVVTTGDAGVSLIEFPQHEDNGNVAICGTDNEEAMVIVDNYGTGTLNSVPVMLNIVFGEDTTFISAVTGSIVAGGVDTIYISGFNTTQSGTYKVFAQTELTDDLDDSNDEWSFINLITQELHTMPYTYSGNNVPGDWQYFVSEANGNNWTSDGDYLNSPELDNGDTAFVTTQKVGVIKENDNLTVQFKVERFDQYGNSLNELFRDNDALNIQISDDCGETFTTVATFNSVNYIPSENSDTTWVISLSNYVGSQIAVRIWTDKLSDIGKLKVSFDEISFTTPEPDVIIDDLYVEDNICGKENEPIYVVVENPSDVDITNFTVITYLYSNNSGSYFDTLTYVYTDVLEPGKLDTIIAGTFNSQVPDDYDIETYVYLDINEDYNDDDNISFEIWEMRENTYETNFSWPNYGYGWKYDGAGLSGNAIYSYEVKVNRSTMAFSPKFEALAPNSMLEFSYNKNSGTFGLGDSINVMVSIDCGNTYELIGSVTNSDNLSSFDNDYVEFSLAAYAGQVVQIAIEFVNVNDGSYYMYVDNFKIVTTDVEILGIVTETEEFDIYNYNQDNSTFNYAERYVTCGNAMHNLLVVVENKGETTVNNINVAIDYTGKSTGTLNGNYSGSLEPGDRVAVNIAGTIDTETPGLVDMKATITVANDAVEENNTIGYSVTTQEVYELPYYAFSNSTYFNESYYWKYDEDGNMYKNGTSVRADNLDKGDTAYAISPKLKIDNDNSHLYFGYWVSNSLGEGHIVNDEIAEVLISSNCGNTWDRVWYMDVTTTDFGSRGMIAIDASSYNGQDIRIMYRGIKGNSNGLFSMYFERIQVINERPAEIVASDGNDEEYPSGSTFCEYDRIYFTSNSVNSLNLDYEWVIENSDTSYVIRRSTSPGFNFYPSASDAGTVVLNAISRDYNNVIATDSYVMNVTPLPGVPTITGDNEAVSNVAFTEFTATADNATQYVWNIDEGGVISGKTDVGNVSWNDGFIGYSTITVQGYNECGVGTVSDDYLVYVEFLNPQGGDYSNEGNSNKGGSTNQALVNTYPNPNNGEFTIELPDDVENFVMEIKNNQGFLIEKINVTGNSSSVNLGYRISGLYHIQIVTNDNVYVKSFVIK